MSYNSETEEDILNDSVDVNNEKQHLLPPNIQPDVAVVNRGGISWYFAVFLISNAALGAGLLNFGKAFDTAGGILVSSIAQLVKILFSL